MLSYISRLQLPLSLKVDGGRSSQPKVLLQMGLELSMSGQIVFEILLSA